MGSKEDKRLTKVIFVTAYVIYVNAVKKCLLGTLLRLETGQFSEQVKKRS